ncbi:L-idonate 5-dehydrogenase [Actinobaculum sp. 352]|uniref:L-idonate 5-dehydrogenase n=1 Tax=Actinobaculum sp. 352 TaxID=2490946 RepID=UPI000F7E42FF|nr:L-idonate 5-dehydrogenase [Actinobaculum sp. 352]RTE48404.1 L-idonate 5-dehydrogenase [Actinobaculum sp. 352]
MKAVTVYGAGDLRVTEIEDPQAGPGQVRIKMEYGGICGSDLAYWKHGASGTAILREPLVLGHEVAGRIDQLGDGVAGLELGQAVTVNPATPVGEYHVPAHLRGRDNLWPEVRYFGSAAFLPHEQGGFSTYRVVRAEMIRPLPENVSTRHGAVAEPLGVAIHAVGRAGGVRGKRILVNGAGPIGSLVVAAAKHAGAAEVWAADLSPTALSIAEQLGADHVLDRSAGQELPVDVDIAFDASGAPRALGDVFLSVVRGGRFVQVGNLPAGEVPVALGQLVTREIDYVGSYRFSDEITDAIAATADGLNVEPLLTHTFDIEDALEAFETAGDRSTGSSKVLLKLS